MFIAKKFAIALAAALSACPAAAVPIDPETYVVTPTVIEQPAAEDSVEEIIEDEKTQTLTCVGCTENEIVALNFFKNQGVTDHKALATILGTIKQESRFIPNICEGGHQTTYWGCTRGGFGLIQFTSPSRYYGLGTYARQTGQKPEDFTTQLEYIVTEPQWKDVEHIFKAEGHSFYTYERAEYRWIGWGIKGWRDHYTRDYHSRIIAT